jgi:hypothetical protein
MAERPPQAPEPGRPPDPDARESGHPEPGQPEPRYQGPARAAPYPLSRLSAAFDLVDVAREIQQADATIAAVAQGELTVIAEQIRALQDKARAVLARVHADRELHRAQCNFEKKPGQTYHLYRREDGVLYFSLLGPDEWRLKHAQTFVGSYRLEPDQSWTPLGEVQDRDERRDVARRLLGQ